MQENILPLTKFQALFRGFSCRNTMLNAQLQYLAASIKVESAIKSLHSGYTYEKMDQYSYKDMINSRPLFHNPAKSVTDNFISNYSNTSTNSSTSNSASIRTAHLNSISEEKSKNKSSFIKNRSNRSNISDSTDANIQDEIVKLNDAIRSRISYLKNLKENLP